MKYDETLYLYLQRLCFIISPQAELLSNFVLKIKFVSLLINFPNMWSAIQIRLSPQFQKQNILCTYTTSILNIKHLLLQNVACKIWTDEGTSGKSAEAYTCGFESYLVRRVT